jgi:hypothetical protein
VSRFAPALGVANAVLYEGYLLYPYTASARKNRIRWQFGVVVPQRYAETGTGEPAEQQTEIVLEAGSDARIEILLRFLQVEARAVEAASADAFSAIPSLTVDGTTYLAFDEGVEREVRAELRLEPGATAEIPIHFEAQREIEPIHDANGTVRGRVVRERWPLRGTIAIGWEAIAGMDELGKLRVVTRNDSEVVAGERSSALRTAFVSTHTLIAVDDGHFLSALDPPEAAAAAVATLANRHTWPVLVGEEDGDPHRARLLLSSPIILYDRPAVAGETDADAFDATEVDELLTLSVLSLPQEERDEARATDPRARAIVERAERFGPGDLARVHAGALRREERPPPIVQHDPLAAIDVPSVDCIFIDGTKVAKGSTVRLHPKRRADAWDMFLAEKLATVRAVHQDFEDRFYVAVTVDDDPASDLHEWYGRSFMFAPDEVEPILMGRPA